MSGSMNRKTVLIRRAGWMPDPDLWKGYVEGKDMGLA